MKWFTTKSTVFIAASLLCSTDGETTVIKAGGATFPLRLYRAAFYAYRFVDESTEIEYEGYGSGGGICRMVGNCDGNANGEPELDFGGSDAPLEDDDYAKTNNDIQLYPAVAGAVVPIYNLPALSEAGHTLVLTPQILARIFRKCTAEVAAQLNQEYGLNKTCETNPPSITHWGDQDIVALNPQHQAILEAAGEIQVAVRLESSGTSEIFKKSLSAFDPAFATQVGNNKRNDFYFANVTKHKSNVGVAGFVAITPGSIGYSVLGEATTIGLPFASLLKKEGEAPVKATTESVENAMIEKGFDFGVSQVEQERLVVDILGATGSQAWPLVGYTYFIVRKANPGKNFADEQRRKRLQNFFLWFYQSPVSQEIAKDLGFAPLSTSIRTKIISRIQTDMLAGDKPLFQEPEQTFAGIQVVGSSALNDVLKQFERSFLIQEPQATFFPFLEKPSTDAIALVQKRDSISDVAVALGSQAAFVDPNLAVLPFAGVALGAVVNFCGSEETDVLCENSFEVKLDPSTLAKILSGEITSWSDSAITSQVPELVGINERIVVIGLTSGSDLQDEFTKQIRAATGNANFAVKPNLIKPNNAQVLSAVSSLPYSIAFTAFVGDVNLREIKRVKIRLNSQVAVEPGLKALEKCTLQLVEDRVNLVGAPEQGCYPFSEVIYLLTPRSYKGEADCDEGTGRGEVVAKYIGFLFQNVFRELVGTREDGSFVLEPLRSQDVLPLSADAAIKVKNYDILSTVTCNGVEILTPFEEKNLIPDALIYLSYALVGIFLIGFFLAGIWIYRNRRRKIVLISSPPFMIQILVGASLSVLTVIPLSMQDGSFGLSNETLDIMCRVSPFLYTVGFVIVYSSMWLKTWRLEKIFNNPKLKRVYITNRKMQTYQAVLLLIIIALNVVWTVSDARLQWVRKVVQTDPIYNKPVDSYGYCTGENSLLWGGPLAIICILSLLYGLLLIYKSRKIPSEFGEGRHIAFSLVTAFEALLLGLPILFIADNNPTARFVVLLAIIIATSVSPVCFLFLPKIWYIWNWGWATGTGGQGSSGENGSSSFNNGSFDSRPRHEFTIQTSYLGSFDDSSSKSALRFTKQKEIMSTHDTPDADDDEYV